jgi:2-polyprenyl-3-methyl-5-hydroxy-6-metoxy-1,4-benzoquinol methylase
VSCGTPLDREARNATLSARSNYARLVTDAAVDYKQEAIKLWTVRPCGAGVAGDSEPGTRAYFETLVRGRREYAPWMTDALGYEDARRKPLAVLDVGCGQGIDLYEFASRGAEVTGIDLTPRHVELARAHLAEMQLAATVVEGDIERMPFADSSFDRVISNGVLHHTPDMDMALRECVRVARPHATVRIIVYNRNSLHYLVTQVLVQGLAKGELFTEGSMSRVLGRTVEAGARESDARPLVRVHSPRQVRRLLERAGLQDVRVFVRHYRVSDSPLTYAWRDRRLDPRLLDWIGRIAGWYVVGVGVKAQ